MVRLHDILGLFASLLNLHLNIDCAAADVGIGTFNCDGVDLSGQLLEGKINPFSFFYPWGIKYGGEIFKMALESDDLLMDIDFIKHRIKGTSAHFSQITFIPLKFLRKRMGVIRGSSNTMTEDKLMEALIDFDITDIRHDGVLFSVFCDPKSLDVVKKAVAAAGINVESAELEWVSHNPTPLDDAKSAKAVEFLSTLHDHDDVQNVYTTLA